MRYIILLSLVAMLLFSCGKSEEALQVKYGDTVELSGTVKAVDYEIGPGEKFMAYILVCNQSVQLHHSPLYSYGNEVSSSQFHIDLSNKQMAAYEGTELTLKGMLIPSENQHHLGPVCIAVEDLKVN